jgi:hypothetical protein
MASCAERRRRLDAYFTRLLPLERSFPGRHQIGSLMTIEFQAVRISDFGPTSSAL